MAAKRKVSKKRPAVRQNSGKFSILSSWPTMAAAHKALSAAKAPGLTVRKIFGKFSVTRPKRANPNPKKTKPLRKVSARANATRKRVKGILKRVRNSSDAEAAEMYRKFHGRDAKFIEEIDVSNNQRVHMAECGKLRHLHVVTVNGQGVKLSFRGVKVCCSPNGGQLYTIGGDQQLDLDALGLAGTLPKDSLVIGVLTRIEYETRKGFHDFQDVDYWHKFGEVDGRLPTLNFDTLNSLCFISGGGYQVRPEGIVN